MTVENAETKKQAAPSFWRMEEPILGADKQLLTGGMWAPQKQWWLLPNFYKLLVGGYGSGKTMVGSKRIISLALQNNGIPVAAVSPTFPMARETTIATLEILLAGKEQLLGSRYFWWRHNKSSHKFTIRYHGRTGIILVFSGDNPQRLKGANLAAAWIDEPFIQEEAVFDQMVARVRHPAAKLKEIILTGTPEGNLGWGYDLVHGNLLKKKKTTMDVGVVHAPTYANKALDDEYVDRLRGRLSEKAAQAYIEGQFVNLSDGLIYYGFDPTKNIKDFTDPNIDSTKEVIPSGAMIGAGMDFNVNPMAFVVFWKSGNHIHYFDEWEIPNSDTEYACSVLHEKFYALGLREIYPDPSGKNRETNAPGGRSDFTYIRQAGFEVNARSSAQKLRDSHNSINGKLAPKQGESSITISSRCENLRKYLSVLSHENIDKETYKKYTHLVDAFRYPIDYMFPLSHQEFHTHKLRGA